MSSHAKVNDKRMTTVAFGQIVHEMKTCTVDRLEKQLWAILVCRVLLILSFFFSYRQLNVEIVILCVDENNNED